MLFRSVRQAIDQMYGQDGLMTEENADTDSKKLVLDYFRRMATTMEEFSECIEGPEGLIEGNTITIPDNVWFIGTANRDESTIEITDKVYDRAQILNFNHKAQPFAVSGTESSAVSIRTLTKRFDEAQKQYPFSYMENEIVVEVDDFLSKNFKVTFGNRIGNQMNQFVSTYVATMLGNGKDEYELSVEAIDYQIANKVLRKLENVDMTRMQKIKDLRDLCSMYDLVRCVDMLQRYFELDNG